MMNTKCEKCGHDIFYWVNKDSNDYWCTRCEEYKYWQKEMTKRHWLTNELINKQ